MRKCKCGHVLDERDKHESIEVDGLSLVKCPGCNDAFKYAMFRNDSRTMVDIRKLVPST